MARKIIVVTAAYGNDHVKALGGQSAVLPFIAGSGADGVEIRRELFSADELNRLAELAADIERRGLLVCYSAPEALFAADGSLNPHLADFLQEAQTLNALWLKLSLGRFTHQNDLETLRDILRESGMALVVENDQTDCGQLAPMQRFKAACRVNQLPITLTFDMGNWLWVGDSPEEAARHLAPAVSYIHVRRLSRTIRSFAPYRRMKRPGAGWRCSTTCPQTPRAGSNFR
jgi:sugar phosphate isomerase/epimerase